MKIQQRTGFFNGLLVLCDGQFLYKFQASRWCIAQMLHPAPHRPHPSQLQLISPWPEPANQDLYFPSLLFNDNITLGAEQWAQPRWLLETQHPQRRFLGDSLLLGVCGGHQEK